MTKKRKTVKKPRDPGPGYPGIETKVIIVPLDDCSGICLEVHDLDAPDGESPFSQTVMSNTRANNFVIGISRMITKNRQGVKSLAAKGRS